MFIELHIIQTLPPSNPNRGQDGAPKCVTYGGTLRSRMSSQSQKRAARLWYQQNLGIPREKLAARSRRWDDYLADALTIESGNPMRQKIAARLVLAMFNVSVDKLLFTALKRGDNLLFLSQHEVNTIAAIADQHGELIGGLVDRALDYQQLAQERGVEKLDKYDRHPTKKEVAALSRALGNISSAVPGDVALFGRMMAQLTETSVDGCVQVADAISVNPTIRSKTADGWRVGEIDFFSAVDDITLTTDDLGGAGMIGESTITSPVYYRYANLCFSELVRLVGDESVASQFAAGFINGFVRALPSGYVRSHAHNTLPDAIIIQATSHQPYTHAPAFLEAIGGPDGGGLSISRQAIARLLARHTEVSEIYNVAPEFAAAVGLSDHVAGGVPLSVAIDGAIDFCRHTTGLAAER